jgi:hypothetical protein
MTRYGHILAAALLLGAMACNTDDGIESNDAGESRAELQEARYGTVLAEFHASDSSTDFHAQFMDARGISIDDAERALEIWSPDSTLDIDTCSVRTGGIDNAELMQLRLLDVGPIRVTGADSRIELFGRSLPDFSTTVSGVIYGNDEGFELDRAELTYDPFERYRVTAEGTDEMGGFTVWLMAPDVPRLASVEESLKIQDELDVVWDASGVTNYTELYLDVRPDTSGLAAPRMTCRIEDDGQFALPRAVVEQLGSDSFSVELRRVHRVPVDVEGLDGTEFLFAASDSRAARLD